MNDNNNNNNNNNTTPKTYDTVVFSRKLTFNDPHDSSSLSSVIHQANDIEKNNSNENKNKNPKGITKLFTSLFNALGINETNDVAAMNQSTSSENQKSSNNNFPQTSMYSSSQYIPPVPISPSSSALSSSPFGSSSNLQNNKKTIEDYSNGYLGPIHPEDQGKKCLVLDLDETLVHSSFRPTKNPDYIIPVEIDGTIHNVYVLKRPGVDEFLEILSEYYEIVVFTASLSKYANPLLDQMDKKNVIRHRLYREHCVKYDGNYVKDLSVLDRDLSQTIIIDNSAMSYLFHPRNAIGCSNFIDDITDRELSSIQKFLLEIHQENDVREHLLRWSPDNPYYLTG